VAEAHATARRVLQERRSELDRLAAVLLEKETLSEQDLPKPVCGRNDSEASP
jgi:ATP-dependent Zn protease